ncbi:iron chaperone [Streptomyces sp. NPDC002513]
MQHTKSSAQNSDPAAEQYNGFTAEERAAMKEHAQEQKKAAARRGSSRVEKEAAAERDVLAKIAEMPEADRVLAERIHDIIKTAAPDLTPKLWYGMPAYARDGKVLCHFQSAQKFKSRYATLGFSDQAALDDGAMWPTAYALKELTAADEQRISALVKKAVG